LSASNPHTSPAALLALSIGCTSDNAVGKQFRKELDEMKAAMPVAATAAITPTASKLAFTSDRDEDSEIFVKAMQTAPHLQAPQA
jgi:hypothetical protein